MNTKDLDNEASADAARDAEKAVVDASRRAVYRLIETNISSLGGIETAAGIAGCERGDLRRALDRSGRYLAVDHVLALLARMRRFNAAVATEIGNALVRPADLLVFPRVELSAEEKARRLEQLVRSMPLGDQLIQRALETP